MSLDDARIIQHPTNQPTNQSALAYLTGNGEEGEYICMNSSGAKKQPAKTNDYSRLPILPTLKYYFSISATIFNQCACALSHFEAGRCMLSGE